MARGRETVPLISWSLLAIALIYGLGSIIVFTSTYEYNRADIVLSNSSYWPIYGPLILIMIFGIVFGWKLPLFDKKYIKFVSKFTFNINDRSLLIVAFLLLLSGVLLRWFYVQAFGGFIGYLEYNKAIRSAIFEINNPYSFLQPFGYLIILASYFFWALFLKAYKRFIVGFGLFFSFLFSLYVYYSYAGRVGFALYLVSFILAYFYIKGVSSRFILILSIAGFPLVTFFLYFISIYFNLKGAESPTSYFIKETSFVYVSFFAELTTGDLYRFFIDFIFAPIHLLPSSWTIGFYETASQANTILINGAKKGDQGVTGGIPVDLLTLGLMQFNILGIFPVGILFGMVIKRLDYFLNLITNSYIRNILLSFMALRIAFIGLIYAHPEHFISDLFPFIILLMLLFIVNITSRFRVN